jgi:DNA-binding NtrC family response regulator
MLFESELFGHVKGAFTDAKAERIGRFELAQGGTLFLDEIGNVPMSLQAKLLRVLEAGEMERVGSSRTIKVDVRLISATNANLPEEVANNRFREDLLYRLNTIQIQIPPLRERKKDIPSLAAHFLRLHALRYRKSILGFDGEAMSAILESRWRGNVRELNHVIERAVIMAEDETIRLADLSIPNEYLPLSRLEDLTLEEVEEVLIRKALARCNGDARQAAQALGLSRSALYRRLQNYGV